jgi:hypothetical protein
MAGAVGRSGGQNRVPVAAHVARGTFRPARHAGRTDPAPPAPLSEIDRRRTLAGLPADARRLAADVLAAYSGWDGASLATLRSYALSMHRLRALERSRDADTRALHREVRHALALLKALNLEAAR